VHGEKRVSVLIADHNRWTRLNLASMLIEAGMLVSEASNGFSALRLALERAPQIVVIGPQLPEMGGAELSDRLRADPVTRHTAIVGVHDVVDADASLALPCNPVELLATVVQALEARRHPRHSAARPQEGRDTSAPNGHALSACRPNARTSRFDAGARLSKR
jgi:CheY-like chemotaxis protein